MAQISSTSVGDWSVVKVRTDLDPQLVTRWPAAVAGEGDHDRNVKAIARLLASSNTKFKK
jgi:hypothetical protein